MDPTLKMSLVFIALLTCHLISPSSSIKIKITTSRFNGVLPMSFDVTCSLDPEKAEFYRTKHIFAIKVSRHGERPLAMLQQNAKILYNRLLTANIEAKGHIDQDPGNSNMTVTFNDVMKEDSGVYNCSLLYWDQWGIMQREEAITYFTIENNNAHDVIRYLVGELKSLQNQLAVDRKTSNQVDKDTKVAMTQLLHQVSSLEEQAKEQQKQLNKLREEDRKDNLTVMFTAVYNTPSVMLKDGQDLVFGDVIHNQGQAYDGNTGTFTAPVAGYYMLHLSVLINHSKAIYADLQSGNGKRLKTVFAGASSWRDYSDGSCVARLEAGEKVKPVVKDATSGGFLMVDNNQGSSYYNMNTFSGYLLKMF